MSATNRGATRRDADFYPTQAWVTRSLLEYLIKSGRLSDDDQRGWWVEPCAGEGAIIKAARTVGEISEAPWRVIEKRRECYTDLSDLFTERYGLLLAGDALDPSIPFVFPEAMRREVADPLTGSIRSVPHAICIMNPPFSRAIEFVARAIHECARTFALLRLNWASSARRRGFFEVHPANLYLLPHRPSFTGDGRTDACEYAWFEWPAAHSDRGEVFWLPTVPIEQRRG